MDQSQFSKTTTQYTKHEDILKVPHNSLYSLDQLFPTWVQEAAQHIEPETQSTENTKFDELQNEPTSPKIDTKFYPTDHPKWLTKIYIQLWEKTQSEAVGLSMKELMSRCIDPESPRWYFLPLKRPSREKILTSWKKIREVGVSCVSVLICEATVESTWETKECIWIPQLCSIEFFVERARIGVEDYEYVG